MLCSLRFRYKQYWQDTNLTFQFAVSWQVQVYTIYYHEHDQPSFRNLPLWNKKSSTSRTIQSKKMIKLCDIPNHKQNKQHDVTFSCKNQFYYIPSLLWNSNLIWKHSFSVVYVVNFTSWKSKRLISLLVLYDVILMSFLFPYFHHFFLFEN